MNSLENPLFSRHVLSASGFSGPAGATWSHQKHNLPEHLYVSD